MATAIKWGIIKLAVLLIAFLILLMVPSVVSNATAETTFEGYTNTKYNVTSSDWQFTITFNATITTETLDFGEGKYIKVSRDFNILIIPVYNCTVDNIYHSIATISESDCSFVKTISVYSPGKYLVIISNPGYDFGRGAGYEGLAGIGVNEYWIVLRNGLEGKTFAEMYDIIYTTLVEPGIDEYWFFTDPVLELKQPVPTQTPIPTIEPTPVPTPSPTPIVTPTPQPTATPTPQQPTPTPKQSGFEAIFVIVTLSITYLCLRRRR